MGDDNVRLRADMFVVKEIEVHSRRVYPNILPETARYGSDFEEMSILRMFIPHRP